MKLDTAVESVVERVAAIDVGKAEVVCCVRVPDRRPGRRATEIRSFATMTQDLLGLADWLAGWRVTRVVMEATGDYWKPVFYVLEGLFPETWLVNAHDVKHVPGRPKTDRLDAQWLARLAERGMLRPSFVPPPGVRQLRDLTRYRVDLVVAQTAEKQRVEKLLEDAGVKVSVVASDIFGVSGRRMLNALVAGERDPDRLADLAVGLLRKKLTVLERSFVGRFTDHHGFLLGMMLRRVEQLDRDIAEIDRRIEEQVEPFQEQLAQLLKVPGINRVNGAAILAEIGVDMSRFPTAGHLASWARFAPVTSSSAGKVSAHAVTGKGNRYLARALGQAVLTSRRSSTFLADRYKRLARRRGKSRALVAVGRSILTIIWHLLNDPTATYTDLGNDWYTSRVDQQRNIRRFTRALHDLGYDVQLTPTTA